LTLTHEVQKYKPRTAASQSQQWLGQHATVFH
jgi:hypothetical protein